MPAAPNPGFGKKEFLMTTTRDMTTGSPLARILAFCGPLLLGSLFQQCYNLADSILVGRLLGVNAFAAVGSTGALNFLILGFAQGCCAGFAIPVAQSFGAGDGAGVRSRSGQMLWLGAGMTALIMLISTLWTDDILRLTNTPAEIFDDAFRYIFIVLMGVGATMLYNLGAAVLRALGDSQTPLHFLIIAVIVNVLLDLLLMGGLGLGVEGAAWATVVSQLAAGAACLVYIRRRVPALRLRRGDARPDLRRMGAIAAVGVPMGLQFSITAVGTILVQSAVNSLGSDSVAAVSAGSRVNGVVTAPLDAAGMAMATFCGQNLGAARPDRIRQGMRAMTVVCFVFCGVAFLLNYFAGAAVATLFLDASELAILEQVKRFLVTVGGAYPLLALLLLLRNSLQGMGFSVQAMSAGAAELLARSLVALGLTGRMGYTAVCLSGPAAWLLAVAVLLVLYHAAIRRVSAVRMPLLLPAPAVRLPERK